METKEHCAACAMGKRKSTDEKTKDRKGQYIRQSWDRSGQDAKLEEIIRGNINRSNDSLSANHHHPQ